MALLTKEQRKKRFKYLGLGEYNKENILKFQQKAFPNDKAQQDSKYGVNTDRALRTFYNVKRYGKGYFKPTEFRCKCGHCSGYPSYMKKVQIQHLVKIREHYKKPMTITSALRCAYENKRVRGVQNSGHLKGYATDFYMPGITDSVESRKKALQWIEKQSDHQFTYGAYMKDSNGVYRTASGMGKAMHTETHKHIATWQENAVAWAKEMSKDESWHYVRYNSGKEAHECPICHNHPKGKFHGWNCIGWSYACWHHGGGLKCKCNNHVIDNATAERILNASASDALKIARQHIGLNDIKVIRNGKKVVSQSKMKAGDIGLHFNGNRYTHTFFYIGNGKMVDCTSAGNNANNIKVRDACTAKAVIRYTGK